MSAEGFVAVNQTENGAGPVFRERPEDLFPRWKSLNNWGRRMWHQWDFQGPPMVSFPYYSHNIPIRTPKDMGMVWEAYLLDVVFLVNPTLPETNSQSTWKWMVGIRSFPFGAKGLSGCKGTRLTYSKTTCRREPLEHKGKTCDMA